MAPTNEYRALVLSSLKSGFSIEKQSIPEAEPGSAIVLILAASILSYHRDIYNGERRYTFPMPIVGGTSAIARIHSTGHDATLLRPGDLVFVDCVVRGRDDPTSLFLTAIHEGSSDGSKYLMQNVWRDGVWAEYAKVPLENCIPLNEHRLCKELGYEIRDLAYLSYLLVPFGGLRDIRLEVGETVIICPATGGFGSAGVQVALAMGARVIAMGRNEKKLAELKAFVLNGMSTAEVETVIVTGDVTNDAASLQAFGTIDAVLDLTPPVASKSTHLTSAISALRHKGRVSLMGFAELAASMWKVVGADITLKGKLMYSREDMLQFVKMLERDCFPVGKHLVDMRTFPLVEWQRALDVAAEHTGMGRSCIFEP